MPSCKMVTFHKLGHRDGPLATAAEREDAQVHEFCEHINKPTRPFHKIFLLIYTNFTTHRSEALRSDYS